MVFSGLTLLAVMTMLFSHFSTARSNRISEVERQSALTTSTLAAFNSTQAHLLNDVLEIKRGIEILGSKLDKHLGER